MIALTTCGPIAISFKNCRIIAVNCATQGTILVYIGTCLIIVATCTTCGIIPATLLTYGIIVVAHTTRGIFHVAPASCSTITITLVNSRKHHSSSCDSWIVMVALMTCSTIAIALQIVESLRLILCHAKSMWPFSQLSELSRLLLQLVE